EQQLLSKFLQFVGANLRAHPLIVRVHLLPVGRSLSQHVVETLGHQNHLPSSCSRCSSKRSSATGMFTLYHFFHCPDLSPAINVIADRFGSKAKRIRSSDRPREPGRSSFMFSCREACCCGS